jgi:hypothetical protein
MNNNNNLRNEKEKEKKDTPTANHRNTAYFRWHFSSSQLHRPV